MVLKYVVDFLQKSAGDKGVHPTGIEIRYGEDALKMLDRFVIRRLAALKTINGLPVSFPEKPGALPRTVCFDLVAEDGGGHYCVTPEILNDSMSWASGTGEDAP